MASLPSAVEGALANVGYGVTRFQVASLPLAFCQGELDCWIKTPGQCRSRDAEADIVKAVHGCQAIVLLVPVTFGGHGYLLKRAVDRLICLLEPFSEHHDSLTHHAARYAHPPSLFSVGWTARSEPEWARTYDDLNDANAVNFRAPSCGAAVLGGTSAASWDTELLEMLRKPRRPGESSHAREALRTELLAAADPDPGISPRKVRSAALLVGSAKPGGRSASEAMARALARRLEMASVTTQLHAATEFAHEDLRATRVAESIAACDLFVLVSPLYVDSLPALATHALELVARARVGLAEPARFAAILNCGFPEPEQNRIALRIARHFAKDAGYAWLGGLALGGGGVVAPGAALDAAHGPVAHVVRALDTGAAALAEGAGLPRKTIASMAEPSMSAVMQRLIGDWGWRLTAHRNGLAQQQLHARPLDER